MRVTNLKVLMVVICILLGGCRSPGVCDYRLTENGWYEIKVSPPELTNEYNEDAIWFTNSRGDFLACPELVEAGVCINVYKLYEIQDDGSFLHSDMACIV